MNTGERGLYSRNYGVCVQIIIYLYVYIYIYNVVYARVSHQKYDECSLLHNTICMVYVPSGSGPFIDELR